MNFIKHSLMGLTAAAVLGMSTMAVAAPATETKAPQSRPQMSEAQKQAMAQKHFERQYGKLNLSKAQETKIKAIEAQYRMPAMPAQSNDAQRESMKQAKQAFDAKRLSLIQAPTFNEAQAQQLLNEQRAAHAQMQARGDERRDQMQMNHLRKEQAIFQVLNKKQQAQYLEQAKKPVPMAKHHGKMKPKDAKNNDKNGMKHHGKKHEQHHGKDGKKAEKKENKK